MRASKTQLQATITAKLAGSFQDAMATRGLTDNNLTTVSRAVRVFVLLDSTVLYDTTKLLSYTAKVGKTGTAKVAQPAP
jgi:hypothetical protein